MTTMSAIPSWVDPRKWVSESDIRLIGLDDGLTLCVSVYELDGRFYHLRLYAGETWVAAAKVEIDETDGCSRNVLRFVEVRPGYRGRGFSRLALDAAQKEIGKIYRDGNFSRSGYANAGRLGLELLPGARVVVHDLEGYSFIDWRNDRFVI